MTISTSYERQIISEIKQYEKNKDMHDLPLAYNYYSNKFVKPKIQHVFGSQENSDVSILDVFIESIAQSFDTTGNYNVISLGAGDCDVETDIAYGLKCKGFNNFKISCFELSLVQLERARKNADEKKVSNYIQLIEADLNKPLEFNTKVGAFIINQSMHHFVELEHLTGEILRLIDDNGSFILADIIGRNGHMRWPETLNLVRELWAYLPGKIRWNNQRFFDDQFFENWDCSTEGFEGVRAQDILPLLLDKFDFSKHVAFGGISEPFIDRAYGNNFDISRESDKEFLDAVNEIEQHFINNGMIKPTQIVSVMHKKGQFKGKCKSANGVTPNKSLRLEKYHGKYPSIKNMQHLNLGFKLSEHTDLVIEDACLIKFDTGEIGNKILRWGWQKPENGFVWSTGIESCLQFKLDRSSDKVIKFHIIDPLKNILKIDRSFSISINGIILLTLNLNTYQEDKVDLLIPKNGEVESIVRVLFHIERTLRYDLDDVTDKRPLGIGLISLHSK